MRSVRVALAAGLALLAVAIGLTLLSSPLSVAASNAVPGNETAVGETQQGATYCQAHEALASGVTAIRVWLDAAAGPAVSVAVYSRGRVLTRGSRPSIWVGGSVTVPVKPLGRAVSDVTVCASFHVRDETIVVQGSATPPALATHEGSVSLYGRMGIEFLRPDRRSWAAQALEVARRMGLGRAFTGTWIVLVALALLASIVVLASRLILKELA
jgi:hypothetical protein